MFRARGNWWRSSFTHTGQPSGLPRRGNNISTGTIAQHSRTPTNSRVQPHSSTFGNLVPCRYSKPSQNGKIEIFLRNWRKLTSNPSILEIVQGYTIPFISQPELLICWGLNEQNISKSQLFCSSTGKRLSKIFKIPVERQSPQISVPLFCSLLSAKSGYKTHESTNLSIEKTLYIDYNLLRQYTFNGGLMGGKDTLTYLLQNLGFLINVQKSMLNQTSALEFLGVLVNFQDMILRLPIEKVRKIQEQSKKILNQPSLSIRTLSKLIGRIISSAVAIVANFGSV